VVLVLVTVRARVWVLLLLLLLLVSVGMRVWAPAMLNLCKVLIYNRLVQSSSSSRGKGFRQGQTPAGLLACPCHKLSSGLQSQPLLL
jgi:hypothetical protein